MEGRVMIIEKAKGLLIGEKVYRAIKKMIDGNENGDYVYVDTFNNCRETGYCFKLMRAGNPKQQIIWVYEYRNSDNLMFRQTSDPNWHDINNRYDDDSIVYAVKTYRYNELKELLEDVKVRVYNFFKEDLA
jgi:hypothetical protein